MDSTESSWTPLKPVGECKVLPGSPNHKVRYPWDSFLVGLCFTVRHVLQHIIFINIQCHV